MERYIVKVFLGSDKAGLELKNVIKTYINKEINDLEVIDTTPEGAEDFVESSLAVTKSIKDNEGSTGILFDETGAGSFMAASKIKGIITAEISDEHSAYMTREHNNGSMLKIGSGIVGDRLDKKITKTFLSAEYSGGRHQIRVDMLDAMC